MLYIRHLYIYALIKQLSLADNHSFSKQTCPSDLVHSIVDKNHAVSLGLTHFLQRVDFLRRQAGVA